MSENDRNDAILKVPPVLFEQTQHLFQEIQAKIDGTLVAYWTSSSGEVCQNDVQALYELLQALGPQEKLYLFIKSGGGDGTAAVRIVHLLHRYANRIVAVLPLQCASAATMIALGAHEIQMGPLSYLTAIDTSLTHALSPVNAFNARVSVSLDELDRVVRMWTDSPTSASQENPFGALYPHVHPLVIGAVDRSRSLAVRLCTEILRFHTDNEGQAEKIAEQLNSSYPSHSYPILPREARRLGLAVQDLPPPLNDLLLGLHKLYSEMGQVALTDYDERNYHNNEIVNILEAPGFQIFYQVDKDWHYRTEERRWVPMNDNSSWRRVVERNGEPVQSVFHMR